MTVEYIYQLLGMKEAELAMTRLERDRLEGELNRTKSIMGEKNDKLTQDLEKLNKAEK